MRRRVKCVTHISKETHLCYKVLNKSFRPQKIIKFCPHKKVAHFRHYKKFKHPILDVSCLYIIEIFFIKIQNSYINFLTWDEFYKFQKLKDKNN